MNENACQGIEREDRLVRGPVGQRKGGPSSGTEPYDARVSRTVSLRRV